MSLAQSLAAQLGPIEQLAYVPSSFEASLDYWTNTMGVGPFFMIEHMPLVDTKYRGEPTVIDSSVALAYWGNMQIELVRQHNDGRSAYKDWLDAGRDDLHHVMCRIDDIEAARAQCEGVGGVAVTEGRLLGSGHFIYFDMGGPGPMLEIVWMEPAFQRLFAFMREAARDWNGQEPLRAVPPEADW